MEHAKKRPASGIDVSKVSTPAFVIEEALLRHNLAILGRIKTETGCKVYQALKTWATWQLFPIVRQYLDGTEVSSLNEARLGYEEFNHDVHMYAPAYKEEEFDEILHFSSTIIFNSFEQWRTLKPRVAAYEKQSGKPIACGLRINPEYLPKGSAGDLWSPGSPGSRLGIRLSEFQAALAEDPDALDGIDGLHFHLFWDRSFPELQEAVALVEEKFGAYLKNMQWVNFGGGQMITDNEYDTDGLVALIGAFQKRHDVTVHLEPGAAIVQNAGVLVASVLDIVERDDVPYKIAILDMSFNAHAPDFLLFPELDMPVASAEVVRDASAYTGSRALYRLAGSTCVTGDQLSHFHAFKKPLQIGDKVVLEDAVQYNLVQCTMFNGVQHPSILFWKQDGSSEKLRAFTYEDFKARMG